MRTSLASFLLFSLFLFSIFSTMPTIVNGKSNLINETCNNSAQSDPNLTYKFCVTSLQSAPDSLCAGLKQLGMISIRLIKFNATNTRCHIGELLTNNKTTLDPFTRRALQDCFELYSDALPSLRKASKDFKVARYLDANIEISAAMDAPTTCEDGFKEKKGVKSPLTKRNKNMFELSAISLSIINIVQKQK